MYLSKKVKLITLTPLVEVKVYPAVINTFNVISCYSLPIPFKKLRGIKVIEARCVHRPRERGGMGGAIIGIFEFFCLGEVLPEND